MSADDHDGMETAESVLARLHDAQDRLARYLGLTAPKMQNFLKEGILNSIAAGSPENELLLEWSAAIAAYEDWLADDPHVFDNLLPPTAPRPETNVWAVCVTSHVDDVGWEKRTTLWRSESLAWQYAAREMLRSLPDPTRSDWSKHLCLLVYAKRHREAVEAFQDKATSVRFKIDRVPVGDQID